MRSLPVVLSIAGSDNSAGAGIQADLKTMSALGVYGVTAITCVVAEVPGKVSAIQPIEREIVKEQIRLLFAAFPIAAVKTGMLYSREIISAVCDALESASVGAGPSEAHDPKSGSGVRCPLVVDPVMIATSGDSLLQPDAIALYRERLMPMAQLVTPNLDEAAALAGRPLRSIDEMRVAGEELVAKFGTAFLVKGAHLRESSATDLLITRTGGHEFAAPFVPEVSTHGTGCTYSAAIAAHLGRGLPLVDAVREAKTFVSAAISNFLRWQHAGTTTDALHHFSKP